MSEGQSDKKDESKVPGGLARARSLTPERKSQIAARAAAARWGKLPRATHRGNFQEHFGIEVDCYVLDDEHKTAVVSQRGMAVALGLAERGNAFVRFANSKAIAKHGGAQIMEKISNPLVFTWGTGGAQQIHGYDVTLLIDVCKAITKASDAGDLNRQQLVFSLVLSNPSNAK
jgi:hypothetical protein